MSKNKNTRLAVLLSVIIIVVLILSALAVFFIMRGRAKPASDTVDEPGFSVGKAYSPSGAAYDYSQEPVFSWQKDVLDGDNHSHASYFLLDYSEIKENQTGIAVFEGGNATSGSFTLFGVNPHNGEIVWQREVEGSGSSGLGKCAPVNKALQIACVHSGKEAEVLSFEILDGTTGNTLALDETICQEHTCDGFIAYDETKITTSGDRIVFFGRLGKPSAIVYFYGFDTSSFASVYKSTQPFAAEVASNPPDVTLRSNSRYLLANVDGFFTYVVDGTDGETVQQFASESASTANYECHVGPFSDSYTCNTWELDNSGTGVTPFTNFKQEIYRDHKLIYSGSNESGPCMATTTPVHGFGFDDTVSADVNCGVVINQDGEVLFTPEPNALMNLGPGVKFPFPSPYRNTQYQTFGNTALELFGAQDTSGPIASYSLPTTSGSSPELKWDIMKQITMPDDYSTAKITYTAFLATDTLIMGLKDAAAQEEKNNTPTSFDVTTGEQLWALPQKVIDKDYSVPTGDYGYVIVDGVLIAQTSELVISAYQFPEVK
jgi:hypothetical protein